MHLDRILVPLDGSAIAETALDTAIELARLEPGAALLLIRAADAPPAPGSDPRARQDAVIREAELYLGEMAGRVRARGIPRVQTTVRNGAAARAIVEAAERDAVDLIVMSTHGRTGLRRVVLGGVATAVLGGTKIPVLLVRDEEAPVSRPPGLVEA
ncbi:MAG TPA: universal stress protein [Methylomirabilota bacterium]|nr:universal stress protein [Methylomirabilota bacterium]